MLSLASLALASTIGASSGPWLAPVDVHKLETVAGPRWRAVVQAPGEFDEAVLSYALDPKQGK
ncbi:hypothetical protein ABTN15_19810, partial [Acinetobacter baumannii]